MPFYVYRVDDPITGEFYIGSRKSTKNPNEDVEYKGSPKKWKPEDRPRLTKEILMEFSSSEEMLRYEANLIRENIKNPLNRNYSIPGEKWTQIGKNCTGDLNGFYGKSHSEDTVIRISESLKGNRNGSYGKRWMFKEEVTIYVLPEDFEKRLIEGYRFGNPSASTRPGFKNKIWINDGFSNKTIDKDSVIPDRWTRGKILKEETRKKYRSLFREAAKKASTKSRANKKGSVWMNNGEKDFKIPEDEGLAMGLKRGRLAKPWNKKDK
jgi:hypothetical protein